MFSTVCPFITEKIYQNFKLPFGLKEESVSMENWPKYEPKYIDEGLENKLLIIQDIIQAGLAAREKAKRGVRWPIKELQVISTDDDVKKALKDLEPLLKSKLNVKQISIHKTFKFEEINLSPNKTRIGKDFKKDAPTINERINEKILNEIYKTGEITVEGFKLTREHLLVEEIIPENMIFSEFKSGKIILNTEISESLEQEGFAREVVRRVQDLRKSEGLKKKDKINLSIDSKYDLKGLQSYIKEKVGASIIEFKDMKYTHKDEFEVKGHKFKISLIKI